MGGASAFPSFPGPAHSGRTKGGARFSASLGPPSRGSGGHGLRVCGVGCAVPLPSGPRAAAQARGGAGWQPAPRRSPSAAGGMVRPAGRARLPRLGHSARAGAQREGERARLAGPGPGRAVGERAPRGGAGAAAELWPPRPCRTRRSKFPRRCSERSSTTRWATSTRRYRAAPARRPPPSAFPARPRSRRGRAPGRKT